MICSLLSDREAVSMGDVYVISSFSVLLNLFYIMVVAFMGFTGPLAPRLQMSSSHSKYTVVIKSCVNGCICTHIYV